MKCGDIIRLRGTIGDGVIVGVTCIDCGEIIPTSDRHRKLCGFKVDSTGQKRSYCKKRKEMRILIRKNRNLSKSEVNKIIDKFIRLPIEALETYIELYKKSLNQDEKLRIGKEWLRSNCSNLVHDKKVERIGTFATGCVALQLLSTYPDDFEKERKLIDKLKEYTYHPNRKDYTLTEGDAVRGLKLRIY